MSNQEIITAIVEKYKDKKGFRSRPVENFLSSLGGQTRFMASMNLGQDARDYSWKPPIVAAIKEGINKLIAQ